MKTPEFTKSHAVMMAVCGTVLFFIVSMYKVLVPQAIFGELMGIYGDEEVVSWLGAAYMYSYALSQITTGPMTDRFGGMRVLLSGAILFLLGIWIFPFCTSFPLAVLLRLASGFGAGMIFTGLARLLAEVYPGDYTRALSLAIGISFFGPSMGTLPTRWLIGTTGWKFSMCTPAIAALAAAIPAAIIFLRHPIPKPEFSPGEKKPSVTSILNRDFILLCLSSSPLFGTYYILLTQLGARPIEELCGLSPATASTCIMLMTILVACVTLTNNTIQRLTASLGRWQIVMMTTIATAGILTALADALCGFRIPTFALAALIICLALPSGSFPLYCNAVRKTVTPANIGTAVASFNAAAFVAIAISQNIAGKIIAATANGNNDTFGPDTYRNIFIFSAISTLFAFICSIVYAKRK